MRRVLRWLSPSRGRPAASVPREDAAARDLAEVRAWLAQQGDGWRAWLDDTVPLLHEEQDQLARIGEALERSGRFADAGRAFERLGRIEEASRAYQAGGEIVRLELLLAGANANDARTRSIANHARAVTDALSAGLVLDALRAMGELERLDATNERWAQQRRALDAQLPRGRAVRVREGSGRMVVAFEARAVFGRAESDVPLRAASVSREHAELRLDGGRLFVRDLGSRNGTQVAGVIIAREVELVAGVEVAFGADAALQVRSIDERHAELVVARGLDRGVVVRIVRDATTSASGVVTLVRREGVVWLDPRAEVTWREGRSRGAIVPIYGVTYRVGGTELTLER